jgi:protein-S-isoprenylcysteine O-methyltransferase Ste14
MNIQKHLFQTCLLISLVFVLPLLCKPYLLGTWPIIVSILLASLLNMTQPPLSFEEIKTKSPYDKNSTLFLFLAGILVFLVPCLDYGYGRMARPPLNHLISIFGILLSFGSLSFRYWAIRILGKAFTSKVEITPDQKMISQGPYRWIRHPSYLGSFVMAVGISIIFRSYAGLLVCIFGFFPTYVFRIYVEEKALLEKFGLTYQEYCKKTWKLIPFVF